MKNRKNITRLLSISTFMLLPVTNTNADILPPVTHETQNSETIDQTHETINLTLDKSELIHIEEEIGSIVIGSPVHINVLADSAHTLVVVPRKPGATHFSVLDKKGNVLMQRHVIVAAPTKDYLRVKRTCTDKNCEETSIYYCPDTCHEVGMAEENTKK